MKNKRRRSGTVALAALFLFMAFVVYRSFHLGGVRCEVCVTYAGRSQCRAVEGQTKDEALKAATDNACAYLASGVTDGIACTHTPPTRQECTAVE
jgi:hypothetical protein